MAQYGISVPERRPVSPGGLGPGGFGTAGVVTRKRRVHIAPILLHEAGEHLRGILGVGTGVHCRRSLGEGVPAVVDLENPVAVATIADDVAPGVALGAACFLSGNRGEEARVNVMALGGSDDLLAECHI